MENVSLNPAGVGAAKAASPSPFTCRAIAIEIGTRIRTRLAVCRPPRELMSCRDSLSTDVIAGLDIKNYLFCLCSIFAADICYAFTIPFALLRCPYPFATPWCELSSFQMSKKICCCSGYKSSGLTDTSLFEPRLVLICVAVAVAVQREEIPFLAARQHVSQLEYQNNRD